jgi:uncharacterized flavoprotein (TIGR03862 family)
MQLAIIGGGPAGLRAAEIAAGAGVSVTLYEAKASVGRKFLVAGKGGLNLTNAEANERFVARYSAGPWRELLAECDAEALCAWAAGLGVETFAAKSGRVYPRELKAAPLRRRWVQRLRGLGVQFAMHHRWVGVQPSGCFDGQPKGWTPTGVHFATPVGQRTVEADAVILALGGGSWPETGSDGAWTSLLEKLGVKVAPLAPANCGWEVAWPSEVLAHEGAPLKNIAARAGELEARGELLITRYGLEGGAIYQLGPALRAMGEPEIAIDFKPALTAEQLAAKLAPSQRVSLLEAARRWNLSAAALAIVRSFAPQLASPIDLAESVKRCRIRLIQPRPLAEAISTAGGVKWSELDDALMLRASPGVFVAGEMIDWEAPTGGYLIQGCFATGTRAARGAMAWIEKMRGPASVD